MMFKRRRCVSIVGTALLLSLQTISVIRIATSDIRAPAASSGTAAASSEPVTTMEATEAATGCTCVNCETDKRCGGLWKGGAVGGDASFFNRITIVVSHCVSPLHWLPGFTKGFVINDLTIISKCNATIEGAPGAKVVRLPNVGRCDHSYAHWMNEFSNRIENEDDGKHVVVFLKDNQQIHQPGEWRSFGDMLRISSKNGFACGMEPTNYPALGNSLSAYHEWNVLRRFRIKGYTSNNTQYHRMEGGKQPFGSPHNAMADWVWDLRLPIPQDLVQVCYAGTFAATASQIRRRAVVWSSLVQSLSRGNSIEEGHYVERVWAGLLAKPLAPDQVAALRLHKNRVFRRPHSVFGALERREQHD